MLLPTLARRCWLRCQKPLLADRDASARWTRWARCVPPSPPKRRGLGTRCHSTAVAKPSPTQTSHGTAFSVTTLPVLDDNYVYIVTGGKSGAQGHKENKKRPVAVVDCGDPSAITNWCAQNDAFVDTILLTHHHWDHIGGIEELATTFPSARIYSPAITTENVPASYGAGGKYLAHHFSEQKATSDPSLVVVNGSSEFTIFDGTVKISVLDSSGHTLNHIGFVLQSTNVSSKGPAALFSGDSMFSAGCGRLFEGTPDMAIKGLRSYLALPEQTLLYPGHEYTATNLSFAGDLIANPQEYGFQEHEIPLRASDVAMAHADCQRLRAAGQPSIPTTLAHERKVNVFLNAENATALGALLQAKLQFNAKIK